MQILITGGAGFIGCHLARHHVRLGDRVVIVDNHSKDGGVVDAEFRALASDPAVTSVQADLTRPFSLPQGLDRIDVVYHLAAINGTELFYVIPFQVARANVLMTINLLDGLAGAPVGRLVYASTSEVYAGCEPVGLLRVPTDEGIPVVFPQPTDVRFSYGTSKFLGEFLTLAFGRDRGVPVTVVRYHNVYGPRMGSRHVVPQLIQRLAAGERPLRVYGSQETRAFCYIDDAVNATVRVARTAACAGEVVHIGNPTEEIHIEALARLIMKQCGREVEIVESERRSGSVTRRCPDIAKLTRLTGFEPTVPLEAGLRRTVEWYLHNVVPAAR